MRMIEKPDGTPRPSRGGRQARGAYAEAGNRVVNGSRLRGFLIRPRSPYLPESGHKLRT